MLSLLPRPTRKTGIDLSDYCHAARSIGCDVSMVRAVDAVESAGRGFLASGRPKILFEGHIFHKLTGGRYDRSHPSISYPVWTKIHYKGGEAEYARLEEAFKLDPIAALKSASWSRFQILGDNYAACGYSRVEDFVEAMFLDEDNSLEAFVLFILHKGLRQAMRTHNADAVAYGYNGASYRRNNYGVKIHNADVAFSKIKIDCRALTSTAPTPIEAVIPADCHQECVGLNNTSLDDRYTSPTTEKADTAEDRAKPPITTSKPTNNQTPPVGSPSTRDEISEAPSDDSSANERAGRFSVLSSNFNSWLERVVGWQGKIDSVRGVFAWFRDSLSPSDRPGSAKSLATFILHYVVQAVLFVITLIMSIPLKVWVVLAAGFTIVSVVYILRHTILDYVFEKQRA